MNGKSNALTVNDKLSLFVEALEQLWPVCGGCVLLQLILELFQIFAGRLELSHIVPVGVSGQPLRPPLLEGGPAVLDGVECGGGRWGEEDGLKSKIRLER